MFLSEIPRDELRVGTRVWNAQKTQCGTLIKILPEDREDISLLIRWDDGKESCPWHFWCDKIEVTEN
jgi:hypothetical protein